MGNEGGKHGKSSTEEIIGYFCASAVVFQLIALALRIDFPNEKGNVVIFMFRGRITLVITIFHG